MSSTTRSRLSEVETKSRDLAPAVTALLRELICEPSRHGRFLNMLSLLEHIGSRKIMATQSGATLDHDTLKHLAEETRHAVFFKRAAERVAGDALDYSPAAILAGAAARAYMGRLDAAIAAEIGAESGTLPYLYMSLIVELRAIWFYRLYQAALENAHAPFSLKSVLAEEELHLEAMQTALAAADTGCTPRIARFRALEDARFRTLWNAVEADATRAREAAE